MKGRKHTIKLSTDEKEQLAKYTRKHNSFSRMALRARIILMADTGRDYNEIARELSVGRSAVTRWVKRWNETADFDGKYVIERLKDRPRSGRRNTFTPEQTTKLIALACEKPVKYGRPIVNWTDRELADAAIKQGIFKSISPRHVGRILKKNDIRPHLIQMWLNSKPDEQKEEKIKDICNLYGKAQELAEKGEVSFCIDEASRQALERIAPDKPVRPGQVEKHEFEYVRHGTQTLIASRNIVTGKVFGVCQETRNEQDFANFIKEIYNQNKEAKKIHIVLDNLNIHVSETLVRYVAKLNGFMDESDCSIKTGEVRDTQQKGVEASQL